MTEAIIRKYFLHLVESLPMNDAVFRAKLQSAGLFPGDLKEKIMSKSTVAERAEHFLDYGIKNNPESFDKLLTIMYDHDDQLRKLVENIRGEIGLYFILCFPIVQ